MQITDNEINVYYVAKDYGDVLNTCGKWEFEFTEYYETQQLCAKAVEKELAEMACHTSKLRYLMNGCGTVCFYIKPNDIRAQRKLLNFALPGGLGDTSPDPIINNGFESRLKGAVNSNKIWALNPPTCVSKNKRGLGINNPQSCRRQPCGEH